MPNQQTFKIAVRKFTPFENAMRLFWDAFCKETGCDLQLEMEVMDLHDLHRKTLTENGLLEGKYDVAHINTDWLLEGYAKNAFHVLNEDIQRDRPADFPDGWSKSLLEAQNFNGNIIGLPFHDGPECFIYRKDLFEDETEQANFKSQFGRDLVVPKTWEDFITIAHFFHRPAQNLYGSIFAGYPDGHNTVFDFCLQLWTRGGDLLDKDGQVNINTAEAIKALDFYRQIINDEQAVHPRSKEVESVRAGQFFAKGEVAMMINWFGFASFCEVDDSSQVKGKVDVTTLPSQEGFSSASLNVYWLYTIASGSQHKETAYQFLKYITNPKNDKQLTLEGGIGCRISTWKDEEINQIIPYYHQLEELHQVAKMLPQKTNWAEIATVLDEMVLQALNTSMNTETIVQIAQKKINQID